MAGGALERAFAEWMFAARPGDRRVYWTGFLIVDRLQTEDGSEGERPTRRGAEAHAIGECALRAWKRGLVLLTQRRVRGMDGVFEYIAVRKDKI